ncbi:MAG TPA: hypothetical protein PLW99_01565, partial [Candidatus Paceibacterota bacterium]|nr:hypothetical protein [Candidatus Paceibacterota bacterium]
MNPDDLVDKHFPRLRPEQKRALHKLGIRTVRDLLYHVPARYESSGDVGTIAGVAAGADVTLYGTVRKPDIRKTWKSRRPIAEAWLEDASGKIKMMWFSQPYIAKSLHDGMVVKVSGRVAGTTRPDGVPSGKVYLANPEIEKTAIEPGDIHNSLFARPQDLNVKHLNPDSLFVKGVAADKTLYPVYPESQGISSL